MKRVLIIIIFLLIISSPVLAFSVRDILTDFRELFFGNEITGIATSSSLSSTSISSTSSTTSISNTSNTSSTSVTSSTSSTTMVSNTSNTSSTSVTSSTSSTSTVSGTGTSSTSGTISPSSTSTGSTSTVSGTEGTSVTSPNTDNQQCSDGTLYNQCSTNKPYFCNNGNLVENCNSCGCLNTKECVNNQCVEQAPEIREGEESDNPNILNRAPIVSPIPKKIVKILESIEFEVKALDPNQDILSYYFENSLNSMSTGTIICSIAQNIVKCDALKEGEETLTVIVSDGIDETRTEIGITVLKELPKLQRGISAGIANTPPVADAGSNIIGFPGQKVILDASKSYDKEGLISVPETYRWYENENEIGTGKIIEKIFPMGVHEIKLIVTDSEGLTNENVIAVEIKEKNVCKNTQTYYFPEDTLCNSKWPIKEGPNFKINSLTEGSCSLFEVCSEGIDYIIEDSVQCCKEGLTDSEKASACNYANENSETFKNCQALYIIKSLGKSAIYMQGYFDAEMCCKGVGALCPKEDYLYTSQPLPKNLIGVKCSNTPKNNPNGYWASDTRLDLNEIALFDAPAHSSLNVLKTGTCVDYSVSSTTLLRKIGFSSNQVMTVEASNHAYNLIRFDLDRKYTIFDTTGNNDGLKLGNAPTGYDYCANIINCYNDNGKIPCPSNKEINGCENVKENIGRTTGTVGYRITDIFNEIYNKFKKEVLR